LSRAFSNTSSNGTVSAQLELNPLHDAAGEHLITIRAAAANGDSGIVNIRLIVKDNPTLTATHWKSAADGNWSDATRWTDGLPGAGKVAMIDAVGSYTVNLDTSVTAA